MNPIFFAGGKTINDPFRNELQRIKSVNQSNDISTQFVELPKYKVVNKTICFPSNHLVLYKEFKFFLPKNIVDKMQQQMGIVCRHQTLVYFNMCKIIESLFVNSILFAASNKMLVDEQARGTTARTKSQSKSKTESKIKSKNERKDFDCKTVWLHYIQVSHKQEAGKLVLGFI